MNRFYSLLFIALLAVLPACDSNQAPKQTAPATAVQPAEPTAQVSDKPATVAEDAATMDDAAPIGEVAAEATAAMSGAAAAAQEEALPAEPALSAAPAMKPAPVQKPAQVKKPAPKPVSAPVPAPKEKAVAAPAPKQVAKSAAKPTVMSAATGDAAAGAAFAKKRCGVCHNLDSAKKKVGPGLQGVFNRKAGSMDGFKYGSGLSGANWNWDEAHLRIWLSQKTRDAARQLSGNPSASTRMSFKGASGADLDNLIAFLKGNQ